MWRSGRPGSPTRPSWRGRLGLALAPSRPDLTSLALPATPPRPPSPRHRAAPKPPPLRRLPLPPRRSKAPGYRLGCRVITLVFTSGSSCEAMARSSRRDFPHSYFSGMFHRCSQLPRKGLHHMSTVTCTATAPRRPPRRRPDRLRLVLGLQSSSGTAVPPPAPLGTQSAPRRLLPPNVTPPCRSSRTRGPTTKHPRHHRAPGLDLPAPAPPEALVRGHRCDLRRLPARPRPISTRGRSGPRRRGCRPRGARARRRQRRSPLGPAAQGHEVG